MTLTSHSQILRDCVEFVEYRRAKTVTARDVRTTVAMARRQAGTNARQVIFSLKRLGRPIYGFDPELYIPPGSKRHREVAAGYDDE